MKPVPFTRPLLRSNSPDAFLDYLLCRWSELCSPASPVTVSAPLLNGLHAVRELMQLESAKLENERINMDTGVLIEEAAELLAADPIMRILTRDVTANNSAKEWEDYFNLEDKKSPRMPRVRASQCRALLELVDTKTYLAKGIQLLEALQADVTNRSRFQAADEILKALASEALALGFDPVYLFRRAMFFSGRPFSIPAFFARLNYRSTAHDVYFGIVTQGELADAVLQSGVEVVPDPAGVASRLGPKSAGFFRRNPHYVVVHNVIAADPYAAANRAYMRLQTACAIISCSLVRRRVEPTSTCIVEAFSGTSDADITKVNVASPVTHYAPLHDGTLGEVLLRASEDQKFTPVAEFAALGTSSVNLNTRFIFSYMGLEQLVTTNKAGGAHADVVAQAVSPLLANRAPDRTLRSISARLAAMSEKSQEQCRAVVEVDRWSEPNLLAWLSEKVRSWDRPTLGRLCALLEAEDSVSAVRLADLLSSTDYDTWRKARIVLDYLRTYRQINRLGRMRNLLVHNTIPVDSWEYVRHIEFYLGECLRVVSNGLDAGIHVKEIRDVLEVEDLLYRASTK